MVLAIPSIFKYDFLVFYLYFELPIKRVNEYL